MAFVALAFITLAPATPYDPEAGSAARACQAGSLCLAFVQALAAARMNSSSLSGATDRIDHIFKISDVDNDGVLNFPEFVAAPLDRASFPGVVPRMWLAVFPSPSLFRCAPYS